MIRTSIKKWEISRVRESDKSKNLAKLRYFKPLYESCGGIACILPMIRTSTPKRKIPEIRESDKPENLAKLRYFKLEKANTVESKRDTFWVLVRG